MTRRVRWECPNGHPAVLGPSRPKRLATVRFCLACSASAASLVLRVAPALEKERERAVERRKAKSEAERAREKERLLARYGLGGVSLLDELRAIWRLPAVRERLDARNASLRSVPNLKVIRRKEIRGRLGFARYRDRLISVSVLDEKEPSEFAIREAVTTLIHEAVHLALGSDAKAHGSLFWSTYRTLREEYAALGRVSILAADPKKKTFVRVEDVAARRKPAEVEPADEECCSCLGIGYFKPDEEGGEPTLDARAPNRKCSDCSGTGKFLARQIDLAEGSAE